MTPSQLSDDWFVSGDWIALAVFTLLAVAWLAFAWSVVRWRAERKRLDEKLSRFDAKTITITEPPPERSHNGWKYEPSENYQPMPFGISEVGPEGETILYDKNGPVERKENNDPDPTV